MRTENLKLQAEVAQLKVQDTSVAGGLGAIPKGRRNYIQPAHFSVPSSSESATASDTGTISPVQVTVHTPSHVPLAMPERITGDSAKFNSFMTQCHLQFMCKAAALPDDAAKVAFVISYLVGNAAEWAVPLVETNDPLLYDYKIFQDKMRSLFSKHTYMQASDNALLNLKQGSKDLLTYITQFNRLLEETYWPEDKDITVLQRLVR